MEQVFHLFALQVDALRTKSKSQEVESIASHPCAKGAQGWGTLSHPIAKTAHYARICTAEGPPFAKSAKNGPPQFSEHRLPPSEIRRGWGSLSWFGGRVGRPPRYELAPLDAHVVVGNDEVFSIVETLPNFLV